MKQLLAVISIFSVVIVITGFTASTTANVPPDNKYGLDKDQFVERHNYYRKQVGVPPVKWSDELADYAKEWAEKLAKNCQMQHRTEDDYGESIYWNSSTSTEFEVVDYWAEEEVYFDHKKRICEKGKVMDYGHYTQMIWKETTEIGAAVVTCKNGSQIWVCNYNPPGNWVGEKVY